MKIDGIRKLKALHPAPFVVGLVVVIEMSFLHSTPADAVPAFAQQTGQPCQECHVGAFGPQLKPFGRDFKLFGYQNNDGKSHELPIAATLQTSVTHTGAPQSPPPAPGFGPNDNFAVDQVSLYYAGKAPMGWGAFAQVTYDGVGRTFHIDNMDFRRAVQSELFGRDTVFAIDINNNPTVEDPWNSTPAWSYPYNSSALAPGPAAGTLIDGALGGQVIGAGGYVFWNNTIYADATAFAPLDPVFAGRLGVGTNGQSDRFAGVIPYARVAFVHDFDDQQSQTLEAGGYVLRARRYPGGVADQGTDTLSDWALDANYQYIGDAKNEISAHATYIHEDQDLQASAALLGTPQRAHLSTARADISYSHDDTWTPTLQMFTTTGTPDPVLYGGGARTAGYVAELAYVPWGKHDSPLLWLNARFAVQYTGYTEFNGVRAHAGNNNSLFLNAWFALAPLGWRVQR